MVFAAALASSTAERATAVRTLSSRNIVVGLDRPLLSFSCASSNLASSSRSSFSDFARLRCTVLVFSSCLMNDRCCDL